MIIHKPLYRIPEAKTHWWAIYHKHYREKLAIAMFTYDPCLLIIITKTAFGVVGI
jgi:hypothetical protein